MIAMVVACLAFPSDFSSLKVTEVAKGFMFTEGPVWTRQATVIFSDIPGNKLYEYDPATKATKVFRENSANANGNTLSPDGVLFTCEHGSRTVTKTVGGKVSAVAETFEGKRLNSPNDVAITKNGTAYFTDPPYGIDPNKADLPHNGVYKLAPGGQPVLQFKGFNRPNGIVFSPNEKRCYVSDTSTNSVNVFDVVKGDLVNPKPFITVQPTGRGSADGIRVDKKGNLYVTSGGGVHVYDPKGAVLGIISTPQTPTNCAFGGRDGKTLYITAGTAVYSVEVPIAGVRPGIK